MRSKLFNKLHKQKEQNMSMLCAPNMVPLLVQAHIGKIPSAGDKSMLQIFIINLNINLDEIH